MIERRQGRYRAAGCASAALLIAAFSWTAQAAELLVPEEHATIQAALDAAGAGDTVLVGEAGGPYSEKVFFPGSGNASDGFITLRGRTGERPVLDGTDLGGNNMVLIENRSYVRLIGFEIRNNLGVDDGSGVRVLGSGSHIEIRDNRIHDIRGRDAMGITVYGTAPEPISDLIIDGNEIHDCEPFRSEALTLNGNVTDFEVTNNIVRDVNNIGIDFIGGETDIQPDETKVVRNGVCRGNQVYRAREAGGGFAGGIYVDGGRDIVIENNLVSGCDLGIEVGAENSGIVTSGIVVRGNVVFGNEKAGIVFGGFSASVGRVRDCEFSNNTCYQNDSLGVGFGELWIQYAEDNRIRNNIFFSTAQSLFLYSEAGSVNNSLDYNLWYSGAGATAARFVWRGTSHVGFENYRAGANQDAKSLFAPPQLADASAGDFHLLGGSPAIDAGDPTTVLAAGEVDLDGEPRLNGARVDIGADETGECGNGQINAAEECDDGNAIDADGCDTNCTQTACGNGVRAGVEECDDGNAAAGDCCSDDCRFEGPGAVCDDGDLCTTSDACDAGVCQGRVEPAPECRKPVDAGRSRLLLRDADGEGKDSLLWKWTKGEATTGVDLGDPVASDSYAFCVYDGQGGLVFGARAAAGSGWKSAGSGFRYKEKSGAPDGIRSVLLKAGGQGRAQIKVKGKGAHLALPALGLALPVVAQLRRDGGCWGAVYSTASGNDASRFDAKSQ